MKKNLKKNKSNHLKNKLIVIKNKIFNFIKKHWKKILVGIIVLGLIVFSQVRKAQKNQPVLTFEKPQYQNLTKILDVSGIVDAKEKANLRFAAGGKVVYLGAKEGDLVKKWQTIATIDRRSLENQLQQGLNTYMKERWNYDDTVEDYDYHVETKEVRRSLDKDQWSLENQVLNVELANIAITNTVLSAPFEGILVSSPTSVTGVNLLATDGFELVNPKTLVFRSAVDEADIPLVSKGQNGSIFLDSYPDDAIPSQVNYIAYKSSASSTGTVFVVEFPLTGEDLLNKYRIGMNGSVEIELDSRENVMTIPFTATKERNGEFYIDVRTNGDEYEERKIETGLETEDYIEIISGLSESEEVLIPEN